jgi:lysophospholipase L1-like esterase
MKSLLRSTLIVSVGLVISLLLAELLLRALGPIRGQTLQGHKILLPTNRVYVYSTQMPGIDSKIVHSKNSIGFRGPNPPADFANWLTLVAVGGSSTECFYLSDGHDWPALLSAHLQPSFHHLWINNAGLDGHSSFGHLLMVEDYLSQLKPKMILFLIGANDIGLDVPNTHDDKIVRENSLRRWMAMAARELQNRSRIIGLIQIVMRTHQTGQTVMGTLDLHRVAHYKLPASAWDPIRQKHETKYLPAYEARINALITLCRRLGIEPILITHPALYGNVIDDVTQVDLGQIEVKPGLNGKLADQLLELYNDRTRQVARRQHVFLIDLSRTLPKSSRYFCDIYHLTNAGSEAVARIVASQLQPYLRTHYAAFVK